MTREQKIARARELREQGMGYAEIGAAVGAATSTAYRWLNPEYAERHRQTARAWKNGHKDYLREYDRAYAEAHQGACAECGGPTSHKNETGVCESCIAAEAERKLRRLEHLWQQGKNWSEICAAMGWSSGTLSVYVDRARKLGYDLPYRYGADRRAKSYANRWGVAA